DKGSPLEQALSMIEKEFAISFLYKNGMLEGKILSRRKLIDRRNNLYETLDDVLEEFPLTYKNLTYRTLGIVPVTKTEIQQYKVQGTVLDASTDETMPGVNVMVK